ncbi:MAG: hypothetical protein H7122_04390 [Chitinophagaceae bacterium]|nr:hypothetical protein [Chitinophagaceae bacterium]
MIELRHYIFRRLSFNFFLLMVCSMPFHLHAQDDTDSILLNSDSAVVASDDDNYDQNKSTRLPEEASFRRVPDTTVGRMKKEKDFAYANDPGYWIKQEKKYSKGFWDYVFGFFESTAVRVIFYILLGGLIIFVLYRVIVLNDLFIFYASKKQKKNFEETPTQELEPGMIDARIKESIDQKQFSLAVRYLYLKTLYALNDKNWIQFHVEATNKEYLNQLSSYKQIKEFRFLTQVYEYVWYGKFDISEQQFLLVYQDFKNFQTAI